MRPNKSIMETAVQPLCVELGYSELHRETTVREFRTVRQGGRRQVSSKVEHYNLDAILAVSFPVRSHRPHFEQRDLMVGRDPECWHRNKFLPSAG